MVSIPTIIWHEATVQELVLLILLCHCGLDVIWEGLAGAARLHLVIRIAGTLVHDCSVIGLVLLSSSDLIENICVDVGSRMNLLSMRHLVLLRLCGCSYVMHLFLLHFGALNVRSLLSKLD